MLTEQALRVHKVLLAQGLETPLTKKTLDKKIRRRLIAEHIKRIMTLLNLDLSDDSLKETPYRVAKMFAEETFSGLDYSNFPKITVLPNNMRVNNVITVHNISLTSNCEHHFVTIDGKATVSYIPRYYIIGLSKINRIVRFFSQRPQIQERLTTQILLALQTLLRTDNVAVSINATHFCVKARGIYDTNSTVTTVSLGGSFKSGYNIRKRFLHTVRRKN